MPLRVCTGFEHGVSNATSLTKGNNGNKLFDGTAGTPAMVSSGSVRTGTYCLEIVQAGASEYAGWTSLTYGSGQTRSVLNCWVLFPSALPSSNATIVEYFDLAGDYGLLFNATTDQLEIVGFDTAPASGTLVADTWYHLELSVDVSANPWTFDWWVDGVAQTSASKAQATSHHNLGVFLGADNSETFTCRYDDVLLWTDTADITGVPFGEHKVVLLKPDTGGSTAEIGTANATGRMVTNSAIDATHNSANILTATSEVPPLIGASATGVGQRTSGSGNAVGIPMTTYTLASGESTPGMRILIVGWAGSTTAASIGMRTFNGTTETTLFAMADPNFDNNTSSPAWLCKMVTPADFNTQSEIDALVVRLGYSTDISPLPGAHAIYAELAVKEATTITAELGQPAETETAQAVTVTQTATIGQPAEAELAQAVTVREIVLLGQVVEVELAQPITVEGPELHDVGQVVEAEAGLAVTVTETATIGQPAEAEAGLAVTVRETAGAGQAIEVELAQAVTVQQLAAIGQALEVELAQPITVREVHQLGQALEVELAQPITVPGTELVPIGQVVEVELAQPITVREVHQLGQVVEVEAAPAVTVRELVALGQAVEVELAQAIAGLILSGMAGIAHGPLPVAPAQIQHSPGALTGASTGPSTSVGTVAHDQRQLPGAVTPN